MGQFAPAKWIKSNPALTPPSGVFYNEQLDQYIQISKCNLVTPNGTTKRLVHRAQNEFYVRDLPTILRFRFQDDDYIGGETSISDALHNCAE